MSRTAGRNSIDVIPDPADRSKNISLVTEVAADNLILAVHLPVTPEQWCSLCMTDGEHYLGASHPEAQVLATEFFFAGGRAWADKLLLFDAYTRTAPGPVPALVRQVCDYLGEDLAHGNAISTVVRSNPGTLLDTLENAAIRLRHALSFNKHEKSVYVAQLLPLLRQAASVLEALPMLTDLWGVFDSTLGEVCAGPHGLALFETRGEAQAWVLRATHDPHKVMLLPVKVGPEGITIDPSRIETAYLEE